MFGRGLSRETRAPTQARPRGTAHSVGLNAFLQLKGTAAFFVQAIISFMVSVTAMALGIAYMPAPVWIRAFLALGGLYLITSTFTLAKVIRDRQEAASMSGRPEGPAQVLPPNAPYVDPSMAGSWS